MNRCAVSFIFVFLLSLFSFAKSNLKLNAHAEQPDKIELELEDSTRPKNKKYVDKKWLLTDLKSALEVKTWSYKNKHEDEKLSALKNSAVKSVKEAIRRRFQIQNEKLTQVILFFQGLESSDKEEIKKLNSLKANLRADKSQQDIIAQLNKIIHSLIDQTFAAPAGLQIATDKDRNILSDILLSYFNSKPAGSFVKIDFLNNLEVSDHEVTQQEWYELMGYNPSFFSSKNFCKDDFKSQGVMGLCPSLPVENFDYMQIEAFLYKLNSNESEYNYRLPTKKEWMIIANIVQPSNKELDKFFWYYENANGQTRSAGTKIKDKLGLYDVLGNLYEIVGPVIIDESKDIKIESFGGSWLTRRRSIVPHSFWTIGKDYTCFDVGVRLVREKISKKHNN